MRLEWDHETPCFHKVMEGRNVYRDLSAAAIRKNLEDSLRRLQTDYIDIYYTHWQTPDFSLYPLEETMDTLLQLKKRREDPCHRSLQRYCQNHRKVLLSWTAGCKFRKITSLLDAHIAMNCYLYARNIMFPSRRTRLWNRDCSQEK